jgi:tetratricopeptide (TPR) repeat protein
LGSFLFADAWARFSKEIRGLLILMTRTADVHDAQSLRICANLRGIPIQDVEKALEESSGIASVVHVDGGVQVSFSKNFLDFCKDKEGATPEQVTTARSQYSQFLMRARTFTGDRIAAAYRTPVAKAAHKAKTEGDLRSAQDLYEQAILADNTNAWLIDRYAYFLFHDVRDNHAALHQAKRSTELLPSEGELWYTRGLIEARLGDVRAAESSLSKSESLGVPALRCGLQLAWAYVKARPRAQIGLARNQLHQLEALAAHLSPNSKERIEMGYIRERIARLGA